jgi:hypothetical protein
LTVISLFAFCGHNSTHPIVFIIASSCVFRPSYHQRSSFHINITMKSSMFLLVLCICILAAIVQAGAGDECEGMFAPPPISAAANEQGGAIMDMSTILFLVACMVRLDAETQTK